MKVALPVAVFVVLTACSTTPPANAPRMVVAEPLASAEAVPVQWRINRVSREPLKIGQWQVSDYRRGWTRRTRSSQLEPIPHVDMQFENARQKYSFAVRGESGAEWECRCGELQSETSVRVSGGDGGASVPTDLRDTLTCELTNGASRPWTLKLLGNIRPRLGRIDRLWDGQLSDGTRTLEVEPQHKLANVPYKFPVPVGYLFRGEEHDLAAAQIVEPPTLRFAEAATAEERELIAVATAALLLHAELAAE